VLCEIRIYEISREWIMIYEKKLKNYKKIYISSPGREGCKHQVGA
jgi:hypothetical protein